MATMTKDLLDDIFKHLEYIDTDSYIFSKNEEGYEIYHIETDTEEYYATAEEFLSAVINGKTVKDELETKEYVFEYDGGRGAGGGSMGGGFNHASHRGRNAEDYGKMLYPAEFNRQGRFANQARAIEAFAAKYKDSDTEYGISVDSQGFVHSHIKGNKTSVPISAHGRNHMVVHNHPSGGNFSDTDLISTSRDRHAKGIVAVGTSKTYSLAKQHNFDALGFAKAVKKAKWPTKYNYDEGADWWLRRNASKYGYEYSARKTRARGF